jgi:hypothetical protein
MISINKSVQYFNDGLTELDRLADHDKEKNRPSAFDRNFKSCQKEFRQVSSI